MSSIDESARAKSAIPPDRHAVPAALVELESLSLVTTGGPGWWLVDELMTVGDGPTLHEGREAYQVLSVADAGVALTSAGGGLARARYVPSAELWVYQDGPQPSLGEVAPFDPLAWHARIMRTPSEPPPVRAARPARELPSLTGRTVRWLSSEGWVWMKALSEPLASSAEITVSVCAPTDYWRAVHHRPSARQWLIQVPLHTLWAY